MARCRLAECQAACCGHGVYVDLAHANRVVEEAEVIKPHLPRERRNVDEWFDGRVEEDGDFPSGYRVGTQVIPDPHHPTGTRCVFLRPDNFCALQVASKAQKRHPWDLKPFYCALYPLLLSGGILAMDDENQLFQVGGTCQRASSDSTPLVEAFRSELELALGPEGYLELRALASAGSTR